MSGLSVPVVVVLVVVGHHIDDVQGGGEEGHVVGLVYHGLAGTDSSTE